MPRKRVKMDKQTLTLPDDVTVVDDGLQRFDRVGPEVHFALPARPTVRQQLEYYSRYSDTRAASLYLRLWHSAQALISEWQCEVLPDPKVDLDKLTASEATTAIIWAGNVVLQYMNDLETLPKV